MSLLTTLTARQTIIEGLILSANSNIKQAGSDSTTVIYQDISELVEEYKRNDQLIARINGTAPAMVRGVVHGLGGMS